MGSPRFRLSAMMFLQYAVWGAWLPIAARYFSAPVGEGGLGFTGSQIGTILGLGASAGAITAPFVAGQIADRYFRAERFLGFLLAIGGVVIWYLSYETSFTAWLILSVLYSVIYMPTLGLSNSVAFAHLKDRDKEFPYVRVWGTIGWIAVSWAFPWIYLQTNLTLQWLPPFLVGEEYADVTARLAWAFRFSAIISIVYALYCVTSLPATRPRKDAVESLAFGKAFALLRHPSFVVLVISSLVVSSMHQIYFLQTPPFFSYLGLGDSQIGPAMTIAQFFEIIILAPLGFFLKRFGFRMVIFIGAMAYFLRYAVFGSEAFLPVPVIIASQFLHGFCYSFCFAAAFIYVDRLADVDIRHSAQTVFGIIILGGGPIIGGQLSGALQNVFTTVQDGQEVFNFSGFWYTTAAISLITALGFVFFFRDETGHDPDAVEDAAQVAA